MKRSSLMTALTKFLQTIRCNNFTHGLKLIFHTMQTSVASKGEYMSDIETALRQTGANLRALLEGFYGQTTRAETKESILRAARDPKKIKFGQEIRSAKLFTEINVG